MFLMTTPAAAVDLDVLSVTLIDGSAGAQTLHSIYFETDYNLFSDGKLVIVYPPGFDISNAYIAMSEDGSIDGGFYVDRDVPNREITVTRDGTGQNYTGHSFNLTVGQVQNTTTPGTNYRISLEIQDNVNANIVGPTLSTPFSITSGALHHLTVTGTPDSAVAGVDFTGNNITVAAYDIFNNIKKDYGGTITLSSSAANVTLPGNYSFIPGDSGAHVFSGDLFTVRSAGIHTITATDAVASLDAISPAIYVSPNVIDDYSITSTNYSPSAGSVFTLQVSNALDAYGNAAHGEIAISFEDGGAHLAPDGTEPNLQNIQVTAGAGSAGQILVLAEKSNVVLRAVGSTTHTISLIRVNPGPLLTYSLTDYPTGVNAGQNFTATVTALDAYSNEKFDYTGTVEFSATGAAILPPDYTFDAGDSGIHTFGDGFQLRSAGAQTITVQENDGTPSVTSTQIQVSPGTIANFTITPSTATPSAGIPFDLVVTGAVDGYGNPADGTVVISFIDGLDHEAPDGTMPNLTDIPVSAGAGSADQVLYKAEDSNVILRAVGGTSTKVATLSRVYAGTLASFSLSDYPANVTAGTPFTATVTAFDTYENRKKNFTGVVTFSASGEYVAPAPYTFISGDQGRHTFSNAFQLRTAGLQKFIASSGLVSVTSDNISVTADAVVEYSLSANATQTAGSPFQLSITNARDAYNNPISGTATVTITNGGGSAPNGIPPQISNIDVVAGSGSAPQALYNAVTTAFGASLGGVNRQTPDITVLPAALNSFQLSGYPSSVALGSDFNGNDVTVTALDSYENVKTNYGGQVYFTSSDPLATFSYNQFNRYQFVPADNGSHDFSGTQFSFGTPGKQTLTVIDFTAGIQEVSTDIEVSGIEIVNITSSHDYVSQGQLNAEVAMVVSNPGGSELTITGANLNFSDHNDFDRSADYIVTRSDGITQIPAGSQQSLTFEVDVRNDALTDTITINGSIIGNYSGTPLSDQSTSDPHRWLVQNPPNLIVADYSIPQDTLFQGESGVSMTVRAHNLGPYRASARIDSITFSFTKDGQPVSGQYEVTALPANPNLIAAGQIADFSFSLDIAALAATGYIQSHVLIHARDINTNTVYTAPSGLPESFILAAQPSYTMSAIHTSQSSVTAGQTRPWNVAVILVNTSSSNVTIDFNQASTFIRFLKGQQSLTSQYTISYPTQLAGGGAVLEGNSPADSLLFTITRTGQTTGDVTIAAQVQSVTGAAVTSGETDVYGGVIVQSEAVLNIDAVTPSQDSVTATQTSPWYVDVAVSNTGGSAIDIDMDSPLTLSDQLPPGVSVVNPVGLYYDGDTILEPQSSDVLRYTIDSTNVNPGTVTITASVTGQNINTGGALSDNASTEILAQTAATIAITSVLPSDSTVTANQTTEWTLAVAVENQGGSEVRVNEAATWITLFSESEQQLDYTIISPTIFENSGTNRLAGNSSDALFFRVIETGSTLGEISVRARVEVTEVNSSRMLLTVTDTETEGRFVVQSRAVVSYIDNDLLPTHVSRGSNVRFSARFRNSGESTVDLDPSSYFRFQDGSGKIFQTSLDGSLVQRIEPGDTTLFFKSAQISPSMNTGMYAPTIQLSGFENENPFSQNLVLSDSVTVTQEDILSIIETSASQDSITQGQTNPWHLSISIQNNGGTALTLDSAAVTLYYFNNDVTDEYTFVTPTTFAISGTNQLSAGRLDALHFQVTEAHASTLGLISVHGEVWMTESGNPSNHLHAETTSQWGYFLVQEPAQFAIVGVRPWQPSATRAQTAPWNLSVILNNEGGSDLYIDTTQTYSYIDFSGGSGWEYSNAAGLSSGEFTLAAGATDSLVYPVLVSADTSGAITLNARIRAIEKNSARILQESSSAGNSGFIYLENPALLQLLNLDIVSGNAPYINAQQEYQIRATVQNLGEDEADEVRIELDADPKLSSFSQFLTIETVAGGETVQGVLPSTAPALFDTSETLSAAILSAVARNTGQPAAILPPASPSDSTYTILIQKPAALDIVGVFAEPDTVIAGPNSAAWTVQVTVRDTGSVGLQLTQPSEEDIIFRIAGVAQTDYVVLPPSGDNGNFHLNPGETKRLDYTVLRTGELGGLAEILVNLSARDDNDPQAALAASGSGSVFITSPAAVQIMATSPRAINVDQNDNAHVNIGQVFEVDVTVANRGDETIADVVVSLTGQFSANPANGFIQFLEINQTDTVTFIIQADGQEHLGGELFTAAIQSAKGASTNLDAEVREPLDATARVFIERPVKLQLKELLLAGNNPPFLSRGQEFEVHAVVQDVESEAGSYARLSLGALPLGVLNIDSTSAQIMTVPGYDTAKAVFSLKLNNPAETVLFRATLDSARGANTLEPAEIIPPLLDSTIAVVQEPALPRFVTMNFSQDTVAAETNQPWSFEVVLTNTGQADAVFPVPDLEDISIKIQDEEQREDYVFGLPSGLSDGGGNIIAAGDTNSYIINVNKTGSLGGEADIEVTFDAYDRNVGWDGDGLPLKTRGTVFVQTNTIARIRRTELIAPNINNLGYGIVNIEQVFAVRVLVEEKLGREDLDEVAVEIMSLDAAFSTVPDTALIPRISKSDTASVKFFVTAPAQQYLDPQKLQARIISATAHESQTPATIESEPSNEQVLLIVENPAQLAVELALEHGGNYLSVGEEFDLVITLRNWGSAETDSGAVSITPPLGYTLPALADSADSALTVPFYIGTNDSDRVTIAAIAPDSASAGDLFIAEITEVPRDINSDATALLGAPIDTLAVTTLEPGINIIRTYIDYPLGAADDTLSTEQRFRFNANIQMSSDLEERQAVLRLPFGYSFQSSGDSSRAIATDQMTVLEWWVRTPADPDLVPGELLVVASAKDGLGQKKQSSSAHTVLTVKRADLDLEELAITDPIGSIGGDLAFGSEFTLQAIVRNDGDAGTDSTGALRISFGETKVTLDSSKDTAMEKQFVPEVPVTWKLKAPREFVDRLPISVNIIDRPLDENTGETAFTGTVSRSLYIKTFETGFVRVDTVYISGPEGALDDTLSSNQEFFVTAEITSEEVSGDTLLAIFDPVNPSYLAQSPYQRIPAGNARSVTWKVTAPDPYTTPSFDTLFVRASGYDKRDTNFELSDYSEPLPVVLYEMADFSLRAEISAPPGAKQRKLSTGQNFVVKAYVEVDGNAGYMTADSFRVQMSTPAGEHYLVQEPLEQAAEGTEIFWHCIAPENPTLRAENFEFTLVDWPRDINSGKKRAVVQDDDFTLSIETVEKAKLEVTADISAPPDAKSGEVRVGQQFIVRGYVHNHGSAGYAGSFKYGIALPEDYSTADSLMQTVSDTAKWIIRAPNDAKLEWKDIFVTMYQGGVDLYSEQPAQIVGDSTATIQVRTLAAIVYFSSYAVNANTSAMKGGNSVPLLGLRFLNPGLDASSRFLLNVIKLSLRDSKGNDIAPNSVISRIAAVPHGDYSNPYIEVSSAPAGNPITLDFTAGRVDTLFGNRPDSVDIIIDILPQTTVIDILAAIDSSANIRVFNPESQQSVSLVDSLGNFNEVLSLLSDFRVLVEGDFSESFGNYPNPFGLPDRTTTTFIYNLEENTDVDIKIYSMIGELVWSRFYPAGDPRARKGHHEGEIFWNGRNDNGREVLNGMYFARITTGSGKEAIIKIGVLR